MNTILTTARKELRSYFLSPVAVIFLGVFLLVTLFVFFTSSRFFARNIADVRPLFEWLPVLLIFLVAAVTMRAWSEEEKIGTLEILMTMPLRTRDLVVGKFLAGMALVALALLLTTPLAFTVAMLGDLDWGPVAGGYLGALLLATAYMSIGLCVSSRTDNQIVALMVTVVVCGALFMIGSDTVAGFAGDRLGETLRMIGSGSRFASIERGVVDLRDLAYYASLAGFFLYLNVHFLDMKRIETTTASGRARSRSRWTTVALVALNALAFNLWLAPITRARVDLTESGDYSITRATEDILARLDEPLRISGYFSDRTHPLLAPLVPQIRDTLAEYAIRGRGKVEVEFLNPSQDEALEEELRQSYDIETVPFRFFGRHEESVVNAYFHILLRYADQYEVLTFEDLVEIDADEQNIDVRLRNLEYDLTRAIKKLSEGFQSIDAVLAGLDEPARLTVYATPATLPEEFAEVPERIREVCGELSERGAGNFSCEEIDPSGDTALQSEIAERYGFRPMAVSLFGKDTYYLYMLFRRGDRIEAIYPQGDLTKAAIQTAIEASIKRSTPGFLKKVAIMSEVPKAPPPDPRIPAQFQPPPPQPDYRQLQQLLSADFSVERAQFDDGVVPADVDVLMVARPGAMTKKQKFAVDQYLMRGGAVIALAGAFDVSPRAGTLTATKADAGLLDLIGAYGVQVADAFVLDRQNARFPVPVQERVGGLTLQRMHFMDYPFFVDVRRSGFDADHVALAGVQNVVLNWGSPIDVSEVPDGAEAEVLMRSSPQSWLYDATEILPTSIEGADSAFPPSGELEARPLAATVVGRLPSFFADKPSPLFKKGGQDAADEAETEADRTGRTLKESTADARLVVVGSSAFVSDLVKRLGDQFGAGGAVYRGNFDFLHNLIDWALEDTDLLQIRGSGAFARTLVPLTEEQKSSWEVLNYVVVLLSLVVVVVLARAGRKRTRPIDLHGGRA
jgi:ABC-2 type transport system permease protein